MLPPRPSKGQNRPFCSVEGYRDEQQGPPAVLSWRGSPVGQGRDGGSTGPLPPPLSICSSLRRGPQLLVKGIKPQKPVLL